MISFIPNDPKYLKNGNFIWEEYFKDKYLKDYSTDIQTPLDKNFYQCLEKRLSEEIDKCKNDPSMDEKKVILEILKIYAKLMLDL